MPLPFSQRVSRKRVQQECQARVSRKSPLQECPAQSVQQDSAFKSALQECQARVSRRSVKQECQTRMSKSVKQKCQARVSSKSVLSSKSVWQECQERVARVSRKKVQQECLALPQRIQPARDRTAHRNERRNKNTCLFFVEMTHTVIKEQHRCVSMCGCPSKPPCQERCFFGGRKYETLKEGGVTAFHANGNP